MQLLDALKHTVTALVLKTLRSSGTNAYRFLAASVLKAHQNALPVVVGRAGSLLSGWTFLVSYSPIIIAVATIITLGIKKRRKTKLGTNLLVIGETSNVMRSIGTVHLYDTNHEEMKAELQNTAKELIAESQFGFQKIFGVAFTDDDEPVLVLNLKNPNAPIIVTGNTAIEQLLGGTFAAVLSGLKTSY